MFCIRRPNGTRYGRFQTYQLALAHCNSDEKVEPI